MSVSPGTVYGIPCASGHPGRRAKVMAEDVLIDLLVLNVGNGEGVQNNNHPKQWKALENMGKTSEKQWRTWKTFPRQLVLNVRNGGMIHHKR